ncbi:TIGR02391 family protein [Nocardioides plantarum]|uniref:TIGR02391 family protein n=1 Tax=Nocardioides plantarum TaxID=29299 RepID=A0ABV5K7Y7_9ACTN|nr:TIGR02391 family protein [Nocardioides plantarum]
MNVEWMRGILDEYVRLSNLINMAEEMQVPEEAHEQHDELQRLVYAVNAIFAKLNEPPISAGLGDHDRSDPAWYWVRNGQHAQGVLTHLDAVAEMNRTESPTLNAKSLHPWVWDAAAAFWTAGHFAAGVETGAKALTAFVQTKSGSRLADREMAADLFSQKAKAGATRLWLPGDRDQDTWKSRQDGLHNLAMGAYAGIRNVAAHSVETGWTEQEALEYLAVLSTVARWAEETEVVVCSE